MKALIGWIIAALLTLSPALLARQAFSQQCRASSLVADIQVPKARISAHVHRAGCSLCNCTCNTLAQIHCPGDPPGGQTGANKCPPCNKPGKTQCTNGKVPPVNCKCNGDCGKDCTEAGGPCNGADALSCREP